MNEHLIELRQWRQFVAVAEALHFSRAAVQLHMTQPPLTQAIALLEERLATRLFDRTKRSVSLTPAGLALLPQAKDLLLRAQALPSVAQAAAAGEAGRLRLAFVSTVGFGALPQWVREFRLQCPGVSLELVEATGDVQLAALAQGDIDAGFLLHTPQFAPAQLQRMAVASEPVVLALPAQHPLALGKRQHLHERLQLEKVLREPLVLFPRRILPSLHDALSAMYHAAGAPFVVAQEAIQMQTIVNLVSAGLGVAWVPESVRQFQRPGIVYTTIQSPNLPLPLPLPQCETSLVWQKDATNPALKRFLTFMQSRVPVSLAALSV